jgi:hypothetical protein
MLPSGPVGSIRGVWDDLVAEDDGVVRDGVSSQCDNAFVGWLEAFDQTTGARIADNCEEMPAGADRSGYGAAWGPMERRLGDHRKR